MKTRTIKEGEVEEKWYLIDAGGKRLGKVATRVASYLIGKHDVKAVPYLTPKNKVIVINAKNIDMHPRKVENKVYYHHSGYPGGIKEVKFKDMMKKHPKRAMELAISRMIPKNKQRKDILGSNLFIYEEAEHKHEAQKPMKVEV